MTSQKDELVWIVNEKNRPLGGTTRAIMRAKRLIHRSTYIMVTDPKERLLLQKRTLTKDIYPGLWEIAAGGVVAYGEGYLESAMRELGEETGIKTPNFKRHLDFYYEDDVNRLWGRLFSCSYQGRVRPQEEEVQEAIFADKETLARLIAQKEFTPDSYFLMELIKERKITPFERLF